MTTYSEQCKYVFNGTELVDIARKQARHMTEMKTAEDAFDMVKADHKSKVTRIEADISDCTRRVTSGYEMREVKCLVLTFRPDKDHALIVRTDSGRVIRKRKLRDEEKQLTITQAADPFSVEADFCGDSQGELAEIVEESVQLTAKEAEELRDSGISLRPILGQAA